MNRPGRNAIIFHMQIGNMHVVLGSYMFVEVDGKYISNITAVTSKPCPLYHHSLWGW